MRPNTHTHTHTHRETRAHADTVTHIYTQTDTQTHIHLHTHTHPPLQHTHAHTHTHTHTHSYTPISIASHVLIHALHAHLESGAPIGKHVGNVLLLAVVGPGLDRDADALGVASFRVSAMAAPCVCVRAGRVMTPTECNRVPSRKTLWMPRLTDSATVLLVCSDSAYMYVCVLDRAVTPTEYNCVPRT